MSCTIPLSSSAVHLATACSGPVADPVSILQNLSNKIAIYRHHIESGALAQGVQLATELFSSKDAAESRAVFTFFRAILQYGNNEDFKAIQPFFLDGWKDQVDEDSMHSFCYWLDELISRAYPFEEGASTAMKALSAICESENPFFRSKALDHFSKLLHAAPWQREEIVKAAIAAASHALEQPYKGGSYEWGLYGSAISLLTTLILDYFEQDPEAICKLVESLSSKDSPMLKAAHERLSKKIAEITDKAKAILPSAEASEAVVKVAAENSSAVIGDSELFWAFFCKEAGFSPFKQLFDIERAKEGVERLRQCLASGCLSFYTATVGHALKNGFLLDARAPRPIDLRTRPHEFFSATEIGDYSAVFFDKDVKPFIPNLAEALGYQCSANNQPVEFLVRRELAVSDFSHKIVDHSYTETATLFQWQPKEVVD